MKRSFGFLAQFPAWRRRGGFVAGLSVALLSSVATAQVIEIGPKGMVTYDGPLVFTRDGAVPITPARTAAVASMSRASNPYIKEAASLAGLSLALVEAVAWRESRFRAGAVSRAGAIGEMQLMPETARALGVDPTDSRQNYLGGALYLSAMLRRYGGDLRLALAAYNAGPAAVDRYGGVPPFKETQGYVAAIFDRLGKERVNDDENLEE